MRAWGWNALGQLGDGTTVDRLVTRDVAGLDGRGEVTAGLAHSLAVKTDGAGLAWGWNTYGQLGNGTPRPPPRRSPSPVSGRGGGGRRGCPHTMAAGVRP